MSTSTPHIIRILLALLLLPAIGRADQLMLYPEGVASGISTGLGTVSATPNPRVPCVATEPGGAVGQCLPWNVGNSWFHYRLAPYLNCASGGTVTVWLRDTPRRTVKRLLILGNDSLELKLRTTRAAAGRDPELALFHGSKELARTSAGAALGPEWNQLTLEWDPSSVRLSRNGQITGQIALQQPFVPSYVQVNPYHTDELTIQADGQFVLDWESDSAARVTPKHGSDDVQARIFGFDTLVIGTDPSMRNYPMLQVLNTRSQAATVTFEFGIHSEVLQLRHEWRQQVTAPAQSSIMQPLHFPFALETDVYHLNIAAAGTTGPIDPERHFMFVQGRPEPAGPPKFGLRCSAGRSPYGLRAGWRHMYLQAAWVTGPPWIQDWNGQWGIDPNTPPEQWWWTWQLERKVAESLHHDRNLIVCLQATPYLDRQREKQYADKLMQRRPWGLVGGRPDMQWYRKFIRAFMQRYQGRVRHIEVENEANTWPIAYGGYAPADYVDIARVVSEEVHAVDPCVMIYGLSGTSNFTGYLREIYRLGIGEFLDGISWHTYVTDMPEEVGLIEMLNEAVTIINQDGAHFPIINTETGHNLAFREQVDQPISPERVQELIDLGTSPMVGGGFGPTMDEWTGAAATVQNVVFNFVAGAEVFTFFKAGPCRSHFLEKWMNNPKVGNIHTLGLFSQSKDGMRTPSLHTLAVGVVMAQMEGMIPKTGTYIDQAGGVRGATFKKNNGGNLAVLWSPGGSRTVLLQCPDQTLEMVSIFGRSTVIDVKDNTCLLTLDEQPQYFHTRTDGLGVYPPPLTQAASHPQSENRFALSFTLTNTFGHPWQGKVQIQPDPGWNVQPSEIPFTLAPDQHTDMTCILSPTLSSTAGRGRVSCRVQLTRPDQGTLQFVLPVIQRPTLLIPKLPEGFALEQMPAWDMPGGALRVNQVEQVVIGHPLVAVPDPDQIYWQGPEELSAEVKVGYNKDGLTVFVAAVDTNAHSLPTANAFMDQPGPTRIELFFDFRRPCQGLHHPQYNLRVHQIFLPPLGHAEQHPIARVHTGGDYATPAPSLTGAGLRASTVQENRYWVAYRLAWDLIPLQGRPGETFGFDVALNGGNGDQDNPQTKSQLVLFGTMMNYRNASAFAAAILAEADDRSSPRLSP